MFIMRLLRRSLNFTSDGQLDHKTCFIPFMPVVRNIRIEIGDYRIVNSMYLLLVKNTKM